MLHVKTQAFGLAVREHRIRNHLSQREAAQEIGVSLRTLQDWETKDVMPQAKQRRAINAWLAGEEVAA